MSKIQSHADCSHEPTKAGRAKCRRARAKFADALMAAIAEPATTTIETPEPAVIEWEPTRVTADNWREHKDDRVRIAVRLSDDEESEIASGVKITGWGKQWINYEAADGKIKRTAISCTYAETIEG